MQCCSLGLMLVVKIKLEQGALVLLSALPLANWQSNVMHLTVSDVTGGNVKLI